MNIREHLISDHGEDADTVAANDDATLRLYHFERHDRVFVGWDDSIGHQH